MTFRPGAFLDRDGVLNVDAGYVGTIDRLHLMPDAIAAVAALRRAGYLVFVATNQSGVARGLFDEAAVDAVHAEIQARMRAGGTFIDAFRVCPHHPEGRDLRYRRRCACRKPEPGLLEALIDDYRIDRTSSFMIGDKDIDMTAAAAAGLRGFKFGGGSLLQFVDATLQRVRQARASR